MSFTLQVIKNGKDIILFENNKYRESYSLKNGDVVWRCLGRTCKASVKTNNEKTIIYSANGTHTGPHPVTMQTLQTPTPPKSRDKCRSSSATPAAETPLHATEYSSTPGTNSAAEVLSTSVQQGLDLQDTLLQENMTLKEELAKLQTELQVVLDHSIESDQRLVQFTKDIFMPSSPLTAASTSGNEAGKIGEELKRAQDKIKTLEETITILRRPCETCSILKEESKNMIQSLRILEAENENLKSCMMKNQSFSIPEPTLVHNSFQVLTDEHSQGEDDFLTVKKKRRKKEKNKKQQNNTDKIASSKNIKKGSSTPKVYLSTRFSTVTIMGDSHVRSLASLVRDRIKSGTAVSGVCKPGAGILDVTPATLPPRPNHCCVLMAGTNDVDAGREDNIFRHLEDRVKTLKETSRVLMVPLTTRHDLEPSSSIHNTVSLVNNYMAELCYRHQGVELLDTSSIGRHHHTVHGLHLRANGKGILANLIAERLACMTPAPGPLPRPVPPTTDARPSATPSMLPYETYAEAAAQHATTSSPSHQDINFSNNTHVHSNTKISFDNVFLGPPLLVTRQN